MVKQPVGMRHAAGLKLVLIGIALVLLPFILILIFHSADEGAAIGVPGLGLFGILLLPLGFIIAFGGLVIMVVQKIKKD